MKAGRFQSYPAGAGMGGWLPAHQSPILAVDSDWTLENGSREQRRRIARELRRLATKTRTAGKQ